MSVSGLSSRRRRVIIIAAVVVVIAAVVAAVAIFVNSGNNASGAEGDNQKLSAQDVATEFLDALGEGSASQAGAETDNATEASGMIQTTLDALKLHGVGATDLKVVTKNTTATVTYTLSWNFGEGHVWTEQTGLAMSQDKTGNWLIDWSPAVLAPTLRKGDELALANSSGVQTPTVLSRDGTPLPVQSKGFAAAIMPAIRGFASDQTTQSPSSLTVYIQHPDGSVGETLYTTAPPGSTPNAQPPAINTSLDIKLQQAAEAALGTVPQAGMAVIIQPSTGKILAVANNSAASGLNPLTGLYPPGSTFKIVTAATALSQGKITPQTPLACPGTTSIEGRTISNEGKFDLGTTSVTNAFAQSCNTTFSQLATQLGPNDLPTMAKEFGIGVDYTVPGVTTNTGHIPSDSDALARGSDGFGQGQDLVSVFGMALAAATAEHGSTPKPSLIAGQTTTSDTPPRQIGSSTLSSLKTLMRAVVTSGTATGVAHVSPPVYGKTGTAQFGDGSQSHGWFVGYQGDLAFAFLVVDGGSSKVAVQVAASFFANGG